MSFVEDTEREGYYTRRGETAWALVQGMEDSARWFMMVPRSAGHSIARVMEYVRRHGQERPR